MATANALAIAQEAREQELLARLESMETLLARQSEQIQAIMTQLGIGQTEVNIKESDETPAVVEEPVGEVKTGEAEPGEKATGGKSTDKPKDK